MSKRLLRGFLIAGLLYLPLSPAADFETGVEAYTQGDYATALGIFQELAEQGHPDAQNNLGVMYNTGKGVSQDNTQAARWYRMAAERGHADAQSNLASLYVTGRGVPQDYTQAYAWFNLAAEQGDRSAASNRDFVANRLSPEELREAQQMSLMTSPGQAAEVATASPAPAPAPVTPPPETTVARAAPPVEPLETITTPPAPPANAPVDSSPTTAPETPPTALSNEPPVAVAPAPVAPAPAAPAPVSRTPPPTAAASASGSYGPVRPGTTLWSIAKAVNPDPGLTTYQMVLALQRANPEAFSRPNINFLRVGVNLRIPSAAEIRRIDPASARAEVLRQLGN